MLEFIRLVGAVVRIWCIPLFLFEVIGSISAEEEDRGIEE
jgi:hypothetical protein